MTKYNATFYYFKTTGKFYSDARGIFPNYDPQIKEQWLFDRQQIIEANDGMPGLSMEGDEFFIVCVPDEDYCGDNGWPRFIKPKEDS